MWRGFTKDNIPKHFLHTEIHFKMHEHLFGVCIIKLSSFLGSWRETHALFRGNNFESEFWAAWNFLALESRALWDPFRDDKRVFSLFCKWHLDRVPVFYLVLLGMTRSTSSYKEERPFSNVCTARQKQLPPINSRSPLLKTLNLISGSKELKTHDHQQWINSDITDF